MVYILLAIGSILGFIVSYFGFPVLGVFMFLGFAMFAAASLFVDIIDRDEEDEDSEDAINGVRAELEELKLRLMSLDTTTTKVVLELRRDNSALLNRVTYLETKSNDPFGG